MIILPAHLWNALHRFLLINIGEICGCTNLFIYPFECLQRLLGVYFNNTVYPLSSVKNS